MANFDARCCSDMKVVFFKPKMSGLEAGFYMDLSARAIEAVESMKK